MGMANGDDSFRKRQNGRLQMSQFSKELHSKIGGFVNRYETRRSAILPVLHAIQDETGWVSEAQIDELHDRYDLDRVHVKEVITFYDIYKDEPTRKYQLRFCNNMSCAMLGSGAAISRINELIGKYEAELGEDAPFSLETFPCLGKCDGAPVMLCNKTRHEFVTVDRVDEILGLYAPLPE